MIQTISTIMLALVITACSSKPNVKKFSKSADAKEEISVLQAALQKSSKENIEILAPVSFEKAKESLSDAKSMQKDDKSEEKVLNEVALARAYLNQAESNAKKAEPKFLDVLAARKTAQVAHADTYFPGAFNKLDKKIMEQTKKLEEDKKNDIKEIRPELITGYTDIELQAIKQTHLGKSKELIDTAVSKGARALTPSSFEEANKKYQNTDQFITQNRRNTDEIEARSAEVLASATKLVAITEYAQGISSASPEETALKIQAEEERMKLTENALSDEMGANAALAVANTELSKKDKLNQIYEKARTNFSPDEAEVYKQGENLVIRMRGIKFPTAKAVLQAENFTLLKKVDDVIESFDGSKVVVEGHTDSTGSKAVNQKLSDKRANLVKEYLEANISSDEASFTSQGYGFEKPLASNKSANGRAQNRRVDIIIQPSQL